MLFGQGVCFCFCFVFWCDVMGSELVSQFCMHVQLFSYGGGGRASCGLGCTGEGGGGRGVMRARL